MSEEQEEKPIGQKPPKRDTVIKSEDANAMHADTVRQNSKITRLTPLESIEYKLEDIETKVDELQTHSARFRERLKNWTDSINKINRR